MLVPLALIRCGGSDNSDIGADAGRIPEGGGLGGASGDAPDARPDTPGPTPECPPVEPIPGRNCPAPSLVCTYGNRNCFCRTGVPWTCVDSIDSGAMPDGGRGGAGGTGGSGGSSIDSGGGDVRPPDSGRGDIGSTSDAGGDSGRDAGRDGAG